MIFKAEIELIAPNDYDMEDLKTKLFELLENPKNSELIVNSIYLEEI